MFKCYDCREVFAEPLIYKEPYPYGMGYANQLFSRCPYCKGSFDEAKKCEDCGEYFFEDELEDGICEECREDETK